MKQGRNSKQGCFFVFWQETQFEDPVDAFCSESEPAKSTNKCICIYSDFMEDVFTEGKAHYSLPMYELTPGSCPALLCPINLPFIKQKVEKIFLCFEKTETWVELTVVTHVQLKNCTVYTDNDRQYHVISQKLDFSCICAYSKRLHDGERMCFTYAQVVIYVGQDKLC